MFYKVFYTNRFVPSRFAGCEWGPFIFIKPEYRDDGGLLEHELTHVKQFWRNPFLMGLRYRFSKKWRLYYEVEAYKAQLRCYTRDRTDLFATFLSEKYDLNINFYQAKEYLTSSLISK